MIDKAERYFEEALTGKKAAKEAKYETSESVVKLMKFVDWAKQRGGDCWNDAKEKPIDLMTEEEKDMRMPFYERTYHIGKQEFRFDPKFIDQHMNSANKIVKDNPSAYQDYKKRALFPKKTDRDQEHLRTMNRHGLPMGYVEFQEHKIKEIYSLFVTVCK